MSRNHHLICLPHHAPKIIDGTKTTTIRVPRSRQIAVGDTITFARWTAKPYRSKQERVRVVTVKRVQSLDVCRTSLGVYIGGIRLRELIDYLTSDQQPEFSGFIYGWEA